MTQIRARTIKKLGLDDDRCWDEIRRGLWLGKTPFRFDFNLGNKLWK